MSVSNPRVSGFTMVRNALALEYPFKESILSLLPFVDELVINVGVSTDGTEKLCEELRDQSGGKIRLLSNRWELERQTGGSELARQTDLALDACRGQWCFYLQADEVLHEDDVPVLQEAMARADQRDDVDGILFEYIHFYGNFSWEMKARNWYRREVRLFKNGRGIRSFRDAQGFRRADGSRVRALRSAARVFHYGHVRTLASFRKKVEEMSKLWGETPETREERLLPRRKVGMLPYRGNHPAVMHSLLQQNALYCDPSRRPVQWNRREVKNLLTLWWEKLVPLRIGEFRNYEPIRG